MYHYVRSVDASIDPLGYELSVAPDLFATHIAWLAQNGYQGIRLDQMIRCWQNQPICPPKPVVITFDDGYRDAASAALPILRQYGFLATFYIVPNFIDQPGYLTWAEVASLRDAGMEIGSHTLDHVMLTRTAPEEVARQVRESKLVLEQRLGISVSSFCYPVGDYDGYSIEAVRAAGYGNAVTTRWDTNYSELLALPRRRVAGGTTAEELGWIVSN
jgi:peptidoglycan/xylan/chitin deacetylase (PgdA/CDA1 family)